MRHHYPFALKKREARRYFDIYDYAWHTEQVCKEPVPPNLL
ncbi:Hypothetical protein RY67_1773 [Bifidobacterium longum subsp. infantis]|uniref:Uncharacterized protein n=1 Tax=Bifidobacterium longum subsp. infantis TaxID=1682 RepID=A0A0M3T6K6_BIFLI|nr:Hypothetical protein RY67_1773 [Bifidobacterium longum subsp. infantis]